MPDLPGRIPVPGGEPLPPNVALTMPQLHHRLPARHVDDAATANGFAQILRTSEWSRIASLRLKGVALACLVQSGLKAICTSAACDRCIAALTACVVMALP